MNMEDPTAATKTSTAKQIKIFLKVLYKCYFVDVIVVIIMRITFHLCETK